MSNHHTTQPAHDLPYVRAHVRAQRTAHAHLMFLTGPALLAAGLIGVAAQNLGYTPLTQWPQLAIVWAVALAVGLDMSVFVLAGHLFNVYRSRGLWHRETLILGAVLAFLCLVAWQSNTAFQAHEAFGTSEVDSLRYALVDQVTFMQERGALNYLLIVVGACELMLAAEEHGAEASVTGTPRSDQDDGHDDQDDGDDDDGPTPLPRPQAPAMALATYEASPRQEARQEAHPRSWSARNAKQQRQYDALVDELVSGHDLTVDAASALLDDIGLHGGRGTVDKLLTLARQEVTALGGERRGVPQLTGAASRP